MHIIYDTQRAIDEGVKLVSDQKDIDLVPHFIYCATFLFSVKKGTIFQKTYLEKVKKMFLKKMKKYGISSAVLTVVGMERKFLITAEKMIQAYNGDLKNNKNWKLYAGSINDDIESFLEKLQKPGEIEDEEVFTFFTPKLTKEEMELVEQKNLTHMKTYANYAYDIRDIDVDALKMKMSDSNSMYAHTFCWRCTTPLYCDLSQTSSSLIADNIVSCIIELVLPVKKTEGPTLIAFIYCFIVSCTYSYTSFFIHGPGSVIVSVLASLLFAVTFSLLAWLMEHGSKLETAARQK